MANVILKALGFGCLFYAGVCFAHHIWFGMISLIIVAIITIPGTE